MSWPSVWQTNQTQGTAAQAPVAGMFQLTPEQQFAMQQQNWQQWQLYQAQLAQWQTQYGDQFQQNKMAMAPNMFSNMMANPFMQSVVVPPPLPMDSQAPPPPPPVHQTNLENTQNNGANSQQTLSFGQEQRQNEQMSTDNQQSNTQDSMHGQQTNKMSLQNRNQSNFDQHNDGQFRGNRNSRWANNNRNDRRFGQGNDFSNLNHFERMDHDEPNREVDDEKKSKEELDFEQQYLKWEEGFEEFKRNNVNHSDQRQYNESVRKMEMCRQQLLQKKESLRQKRLDANRKFRQNESFQRSDDEQRPIQSNFPGTDHRKDGLDLAPSTSQSAPKADTNIVADVNNILGNPEIQSLLSNIQKQQNDASQPQNEGASRRIEQHGMNRFGNRENDTFKPNPFRPNQGNDFIGQQQCTQQAEDNQQRRNWNANASNENHFKRNRSSFSQQIENDEGFGRLNKRSRFDGPSNSGGNDDYQDFRSRHPINYQNRFQNQSSGNISGNAIADNSSANREQLVEYFPHKVIEYNHKSKIHPYQASCATIQIEYNHTKNGISLHEHPPPKAIEKPKPVEQTQKENYGQLRQPNWSNANFDRRNSSYDWPNMNFDPPNNYERSNASFDRQERFPQGATGGNQGRYSHGIQGQYNYQDRYDNNRQNISTNVQHPDDNQSYYRQNTQEKNWHRNQREWNHPNDYGYDRIAESRNEPQEIESKSVPNTSTAHQRKEVTQNPKFNLKDLLFVPGRNNRPKKIVIIMRGIPGSGKSYIAKMIKDKEQEMGGSARILSIDDYYMTEDDTEKDSYDPNMEEMYTQYLLKSFKKTLSDNLFNCIIVDCKNTTLQYLTFFYNIASSHLFTPFICEMPSDLDKCLKNNIHNRSESEVRKAKEEWAPAPAEYTLLNYECLFSTEENIEEISDEDEKDGQTESVDAVSEEDNTNSERNLAEDDLSDTGDEPTNEFGVFKSKWDNDTTENKLARLDGTNKRIKHTTIEDYLQMDGWEPPPMSTNGKKRVRWADIEAKREHDKQRAIGFVVGQTNWKNLIDQPRDHSSALERVKYIEKVKKN